MSTTPNDTPAPTPAKPWYQSKIILLAGASALIFGGNALSGFLTGAGVTPEQIDIIRATQPQIAEAVEQFKGGQNILNTILGVLMPALIAIARRWWTNIPLLQ